MAQRDDLVTREFVDLEKHTAIALDPSRDLRGWRMFDENNVFVAHAPAHETRHSSRFGLLSHATRITSLGRLKLYELMEAVTLKRILYSDTDSILFICKNGEPNPLQSKVTGFIGELSSEVPEGHFISEFVCNGPKCYSYVLNRKRTRDQMEVEETIEIVKSKGIHQTEKTSALCHQSLTKIVTDHLDPDQEPYSFVVPQSNIVRPEIGTLKSVENTKIVRHVNTKATVIGTDPLTAFRLPYGY